METLKEYSITIFAFGVGAYLLTATQVHAIEHVIIGILVAFAAILSILQYGGMAVGWKVFMANKDLFGPGSEDHERALILFDNSVAATRPYQNKIAFLVSFLSSVVLMAGLLNQGWTILFALEFVSSVIGYAVVRSFLTNYHDIYGYVNGSAS